MIGYGIVKSIPRLILLIFVIFMGIFLWSFGIAYLYELDIKGVQYPPGILSFHGFTTSYFWMILVITVYSTTLIGINYSVRRKIPALIAIPLILIFSTGISMTVAFLQERSTLIPTIDQPVSSNIEIKPGTIFVKGSDKQIVLDNPKGPYVIAELLPKTSGIIDSLIDDATMLGRYFSEYWSLGYIPFVIFLAFILYFLTSLRPIVSLSEWPLANLLTGLLLIRFSLWIQNFLLSEHIVQIIAKLSGPLLPAFLIPYTGLLPLFLLGSILHVFAILLFLSKDKNSVHR